MSEQESNSYAIRVACNTAVDSLSDDECREFLSRLLGEVVANHGKRSSASALGEAIDFAVRTTFDVEAIWAATL